MKMPLFYLAPIAIAGLLVGCGPAPQHASSSSPAATSTPSTTSTGMAMSTAATHPTATQKLICSDEAQEDLAGALGVGTRPRTTSRYMNAQALYQCDYHLSQGRLRLSVKHLDTPAAALGYLQSESRARGARTALAGLGEEAYGDRDGLVYTIKDNEVLAVDTSNLPRVFGTEGQERDAFAYEAASIILGCWTGDE